MAPRDSTQPRTPHEELENIVSHKKHLLLEDNKTPLRIRSLLEQKRDPKCTTEVIAHIVFPDPKSQKSRGFMLSALRSGSLKDKEFTRLKSEIQRADHLTEHTRISLLNILDDIR